MKKKLSLLYLVFSDSYTCSGVVYFHGMLDEPWEHSTCSNYERRGMDFDLWRLTDISTTIGKKYYFHYQFVVFKPFYNTKLLLQRNHRIWKIGLICKASNLVSHYTRWHSKIILLKDLQRFVTMCHTDFQNKEFSFKMFAPCRSFDTKISLVSIFNTFSRFMYSIFTCSKLTIKTLEEVVKHVQS